MCVQLRGTSNRVHVCFSFFCPSPTVLAEEEAKGQAEPGRVLFDVVRSSAADDSLQNGSLVLCNPGTSSVPDSDSQTPEPQVHVPPPAAAPQDGRDYEVASSVADLSHSEDVTEASKDNTSVGHFGERVYPQFQ